MIEPYFKFPRFSLHYGEHGREPGPVSCARAVLRHRPYGFDMGHAYEDERVASFFVHPLFIE
jgi:hypothetical protein